MAFEFWGDWTAFPSTRQPSRSQGRLDAFHPAPRALPLAPPDQPDAAIARALRDWDAHRRADLEGRIDLDVWSRIRGRIED